MINYNENETENKKYINRSNINRTRSRHRHKCTNYKMCHSTIMVMCNKQDLTTSEAEFIKQHWGWIEKSIAYKKTVFIGQNALDQSDCRIFKSPFSPEQIDETASFFAWWYKFTKIKSWSKFFWSGMGKYECGQLVSEL